MKRNRVASFVDDLLSNRRPKRFKADPADAELLRTAIAMRAASPGEDAPQTQFVDQLRRELAAQVAQTTASSVRPAVTRRSRILVGAAATIAVIGGTVAATTGVEHALAAAPAVNENYAQLLRVGTFESKDGHTIGRIVTYSGDPSWVLMNIRAPGMSGTVRCQIELDNHESGPTGTFVVHNGTGEWARPISVDTSRIRGVQLSTPGGSVLATASFNES